jgi:hypothetical protein
MPTITLTEEEAHHIRDLIQRDKESLWKWSHTYVLPEWLNSHKLVIALDEELLKKFENV